MIVVDGSALIEYYWPSGDSRVRESVAAPIAADQIGGGTYVGGRPSSYTCRRTTTRRCTMDPKHLGSSFDDFLREEGLLEEAEAVAAGRTLAQRLADGSSNDELDALDGAAAHSDEFDGST